MFGGMLHGFLSSPMLLHGARRGTALCAPALRESARAPDAIRDDVTSSSTLQGVPPTGLPVGMTLPALVLAVALIGDALIYVVLPLYHQEFGVSLAMVACCSRSIAGSACSPTPPSPISASGSARMR
jgi:hypothetical protein